MGLDQLFVDSTYVETTSSSTINTVDFRHLTTSFFIRHWFGEKVTLKGYANYFIIDEDFNFNGTNETENTGELVTGGTFEFVF